MDSFSHATAATCSGRGSESYSEKRHVIGVRHFDTQPVGSNGLTVTGDRRVNQRTTNSRHLHVFIDSKAANARRHSSLGFVAESTEKKQSVN